MHDGLSYSTENFELFMYTGGIMDPVKFAQDLKELKSYVEDMEKEEILYDL